MLIMLLFQQTAANTYLFLLIVGANCLRCFDTAVWASGRASGLYKSGDEVLVWLSVCREVQIVCIWSS